MEYDRVAVIPYRRRLGRVEVLMVTSRETRRWIFPKGHVESHLGPIDSAALEAYEEAGVRGIISVTPLGIAERTAAGETQRVNVFLLKVKHELQSWPEMNERERKWMLVNDALKVADDSFRPILLMAAELLH